MNFESNRKKMSWKQCEFIGCMNKFYGSQFQRYCNDKRCKERRKELWVDSKKRKDPDAKNLILPKLRFREKIKNGTVLKLRCRAKDGYGHRCQNKFNVIYEKNKEVYPMFCPEHRNAYKRQRFLLKKESDNCHASRHTC